MQNSLKSQLLRWKNAFRVHLSKYPSLYLPLARLKRKNRDIIVNKKTDIVIEGYPRSGNTFSVVAFKLAQKRHVSIARHTHAPAQVIWAARKGIPIIVVIRKPTEAVISLLIRYPYLKIQHEIKNYIHFYKSLIPYNDKFIIAPFEEVVMDFGKVIEKLNNHFGRNFSLFNHTVDNVNKCFHIIEKMDLADTGFLEVNVTTVARPSKERDELKCSLFESAEREDTKKLITKAEEIYKEFLYLSYT